MMPTKAGIRAVLCSAPVATKQATPSTISTPANAIVNFATNISFAFGAVYVECAFDESAIGNFEWFKDDACTDSKVARCFQPVRAGTPALREAKKQSRKRNSLDAASQTLLFFSTFCRSVRLHTPRAGCLC
jgi:hypothetical protein